MFFKKPIYAIIKLSKKGELPIQEINLPKDCNETVFERNYPNITVSITHLVKGKRLAQERTKQFTKRLKTPHFYIRVK